MSVNLEVYYCEKNKKALQILKSQGIIPCGNKAATDNIINYQGHTLKLLPANSSDGAQEKHLPTATFDGDSLIIKIGEVMHPMTSEHLIEWITIIYDNFVQHGTFDHEETPQITFHVGNAKKVDIYSYCNLHGLWKITATR